MKQFIFLLPALCFFTKNIATSNCADSAAINTSLEGDTIISAAGAPCAVYSNQDEADMQFTAQLTFGNNVALDWQTKKEANTFYFTIERSVDKNAWELVAVINAAGNSSSTKMYTAIDRKPYAGSSYYRLKQTNADGKYSYSGVNNIQINKATSGQLIAYFNLAESQITLQGQPKDINTLKICNEAREDVTQKVSIYNLNDSVLLLDLSELSKGPHSIKTDGASIKFIKQ